MPALPRAAYFPIVGERNLITTAFTAVSLPVKDREGKCSMIGNHAPEIELPDHLGRACSLHATIQLGRPIVLFFFPLAGSPHCTKESCAFRDAIAQSPIFNDLNAIVIGISQDSPARAKRFVEEHKLGFRILADVDRRVMDQWGVGTMLFGLLNRRCTFIIDHEGVVRGMCEGTFNWKGHRRFAEAWLTRIEHEIAGRNRRQFYAASVPTELGRLEAGTGTPPIRAAEEAGPIRVVYAPSMSEGSGIGRAPRHGAGGVAQAPKPEEVMKDLRKGRPPKSNKQRPTTPSSSKSARLGNYVRSPSLGRHKAHRLSAQQQRDAESAGASSVQGSADGDGSTRSRSGSFSRSGSVLPDGTFHDESAPAVPPIPPTYENVDESARLDHLNPPPTGVSSSMDESDNGKDALSPRWGHDSTWGTNSSASVSTAETSASSPRRSDSEQRAAGSSLYEKGTRNGKGALPPLPPNGKSAPPPVPPVPKRSARRPSASQVHSRMEASLPQLPASASFADSMRDEVARHYSDKDRDVAYDVPVNATDDTEEFVTLNEGGLLEVQPSSNNRPRASERSESSLASTLHGQDAPVTPSGLNAEELVNGLGIQSLRLKDEESSARNGGTGGQLYASSSNGSVDDFGRRGRRPSTNPNDSGDETKRHSIGSARSARGLPSQSPVPKYAPPPPPAVPGSSSACAIPVSASSNLGKWQGSGWHNSDPFGAKNSNIGTLSPPFFGSSPDSYDSHSRKDSIVTQSSASQGSHSRRPSGSRAPEREGNVMFDAEAFGRVNLL